MKTYAKVIPHQYIRKMSKTSAVIGPNRKKEVPEVRIFGDVEYLSFPLLESTGMVKHLFSTRIGGVSQGIYASMNLSFARGDAEEAVQENYRRIARVLDCRPEDFVCGAQTHTSTVRVVTQEDRGKGVTRTKDYQDVDGLVTNVSGIVLATTFADCVPLYFVDPVKGAIGLSHSGWKGTVQEIGRITIETMVREYGSNPKDILCAIGPSICGSCYEVGEDVASQFANYPEGVVTSMPDSGKYQLDLWMANRVILERAGILPEHIQVTDICTCCNAELLFSHRASHGKRGNLAAFLGLQ